MLCAPVAGEARPKIETLLSPVVSCARRSGVIETPFAVTTLSVIVVPSHSETPTIR